MLPLPVCGRLRAWGARATHGGGQGEEEEEEEEEEGMRCGGGGTSSWATHHGWPLSMRGAGLAWGLQHIHGTLGGWHQAIDGLSGWTAGQGPGTRCSGEKGQGAGDGVLDLDAGGWMPLAPRCTAGEKRVTDKWQSSKPRQARQPARHKPRGRLESAAARLARGRRHACTCPAHGQGRARQRRHLFFSAPP